MNRFRFGVPEREQLDSVFHRRKRETPESCREFIHALERVVHWWRYKHEGEESSDWTELRKRARKIRKKVDGLIEELEESCKDPRYGSSLDELYLADEDYRGILEQLRDNFTSPRRKKTIDHAQLELDVEVLLVIEGYGIEIKKSERGDAVHAFRLCYVAAGQPLTPEAARKHVERFLSFPRGERGPGSITVPS